MKKVYQIDIEETLRKTIFVKAEDEENALDLAKELYDNEEVVLDEEDFVETEYFVVKEMNICEEN